MSYKGEVLYLDATENHLNDMIKLRVSGWVVIHCHSVADAVPYLTGSISAIVAKLGIRIVNCFQFLIIYVI